MQENLRVGLIGYGYAGATIHAPLVAAVPGLQLAKVASSSAAKVYRDWPEVAVVESPTALVDDPDIDLVIIATPNATHHALARQALMAGKHVVVDKPFVVHAGEGRELDALARARSRILSVFQNRRWDSDFLTVRKVIAAGLLGTVHTCESNFDRYRPVVRKRWRESAQPGAGLLYDLGSHLIDQALVLFGLPQGVQAHVAAQRPGSEGADYFSLALDYPGTRVVLEAGSLVRTPGARFTLHGSLGSFIKHGLDGQEEALKAGLRPGAATWGAEPDTAYGKLDCVVSGLEVKGQVTSEKGAYEAYYTLLRDAILAGGPPPVSAPEATRVVEIIEAALRSHAEQRRVPCG